MMTSKTRRRSRGLETLVTLYGALTKRILALWVQGRSPKTEDWYVESLYAFALYLSNNDRKG